MRWLLGLILILCFSASMTAQTRRFQEGQFVLKVKSDFRGNCDLQSIDVVSIQDVLGRLGEVHVSKKFPNQQDPNDNRSATNSVKAKTDLSLIYDVFYTAKVSPIKAAEWMSSTGAVEYAEPAFIAKPLGVPNDALIGKQWHLAAIKAYDAWDLNTGTGNKTVAIIDTGVDWDHPDLADAIELNLEDPIDGLDNDENGYIDDYRGWNFYDDNNDPNELSWSHGTHVAGLAGAITNNEIGVAGSGYSCKILAIKSGNQLELTHGYEGIVYAVKRNADVINCSWGSTDYTSLGHDVVKYASEEGKLVVCGGGNNNNDYNFYPAAFPEAMAVSAADSLTNKATFSSFYYDMDISAPGQVVFSTKNDTYDYDNGTSMSSPIVAGAAALVLDHFGYMPPAQLKAQLMETATNIDSLNLNSAYAHRLGAGLLNMKAALDSMVELSIGMENYIVSDNDDEVYVVGDEISIGIELINYLGPSPPITVKLSLLDDLAELVDSVKFFPALSENGRVNNMNDRFIVKVVNQRKYNEFIDLRLDIVADEYQRTEHLRVLINPDFVNVTVNDISTTVSSMGHVGYANNSRTAGLGLQLENEGNFLYEAGLLIGTEVFGYTKVADRVRGEEYTDRDFWPITVIQKDQTPTNTAFYAQGRFNDTSAISDEIGLEMTQQVWAFEESGHRNYAIVEYTITNVSEKDLNDLQVGMYADWDILNAAENRGVTAYGKRLAFVHSSSDVPYSGGIVQLNADLPFHSFMIDNSTAIEGVDLANNGFSSEEKWYALTHDKLTVGDSGAGVDVSHVISAGSIALAQGDSHKVAFAFIATKNQTEMLASADSAFKRYNGFLPGQNILTPIQSINLAPNPTSNVVRVSFDLKSAESLTFDLLDINGKVISHFGDFAFFAGPNIHTITMPNINSGSYFLRIYNDDIVRTEQVNYIRP